MKKLIFAVSVILCLGAAVGTPAYARTVYYNTDSGIWHNSSCQHHRCKNCIKIEEADARRRGRRACLVCGG